MDKTPKVNMITQKLTRLKNINQQPTLGSKTIILKETTDLKEYKDAFPEYIDFFEDYKSSNKKARMICSIVNSILTQRRIYFSFSATTLKELFNSDNNLKKVTLQSSEYTKIIDKLESVGLIEIIQKPQGPFAYGFKVKDSDLLVSLEGVDESFQKEQLHQFVGLNIQDNIQDNMSISNKISISNLYSSYGSKKNKLFEDIYKQFRVYSSSSSLLAHPRTSDENSQSEELTHTTPVAMMKEEPKRKVALKEKGSELSYMEKLIALMMMKLDIQDLVFVYSTRARFERGKTWVMPLLDDEKDMIDSIWEQVHNLEQVIRQDVEDFEITV